MVIYTYIYMHLVRKSCTDTFEQKKYILHMLRARQLSIGYCYDIHVTARMTYHPLNSHDDYNELKLGLTI